MNMNMTTKNNHVIYKLRMWIVRLFGFDSDSIILLYVLNVFPMLLVFSSLIHILHHVTEI